MSKQVARQWDEQKYTWNPIRIGFSVFWSIGLSVRFLLIFTEFIAIIRHHIFIIIIIIIIIFLNTLGTLNPEG